MTISITTYRETDIANSMPVNSMKGKSNRKEIRNIHDTRKSSITIATMTMATTMTTTIAIQ